MPLEKTLLYFLGCNSPASRKSIKVRGGRLLKSRFQKRKPEGGYGIWEAGVTIATDVERRSVAA
jgi:hypothetical protein